MGILRPVAEQQRINCRSQRLGTAIVRRRWLQTNVCWPGFTYCSFGVTGANPHAVLAPQDTSRALRLANGRL